MQSSGTPFNSQSTMGIIISANDGVLISWELMNYKVSIVWTLFCIRILMTDQHFMTLIVLRKMVLDLLRKFKILLRKLNLAKFLKCSQCSQNSRGTHLPHAQVIKENSQKGDKEGWPIHMSMVKTHSILKQS
jgi:hypothetical protein